MFFSQRLIRRELFSWNIWLTYVRIKKMRNGCLGNASFNVHTWDHCSLHSGEYGTEVSFLALLTILIKLEYPVANVHENKLVVRTEFCFRCDIRKNPICWGENYDKENQVKHKEKGQLVDTTWWPWLVWFFVLSLRMLFRISARRE